MNWWGWNSWDDYDFWAEDNGPPDDPDPTEKIQLEIDNNSLLGQVLGLVDRYQAEKDLMEVDNVRGSIRASGHY